MSDTSFQELAGSQYVYTVYRHHAYVAVGHNVIELLLNAEAPNFHRISVGHSPIQVEVRDFGGETYLYVLYEQNDRGYVAAYRKNSNRDWSKYGQRNLLVYSPQWFDLSRMSNIVFFTADDWLYSYQVMYVAVAVGYRIYFKEILDEFEFTVNIPKPCDHIVSINFNENKQTLFVVCTNVTFYFNYLEYQIYESSLWNRTGQTYFSQDGRIAAIATNHSGDMTTVTIHGLHFEEVENEQEKVYEFQHFHHVASRSLIIQGEFVTVSSTRHYFCYIEALEFGILCINVEQAIQNVRNDGILNDAMVVLPNTHSVACSAYTDCPIMYSHHSLLVAQIQVCDNNIECETIVMLFNMSTLENIANLTGVSLDMHAYKPHPNPILLSPPPTGNATLQATSASPQPSTRSIVTPSISATSPTVKITVNGLVPTPAYELETPPPNSDSTLTPHPEDTTASTTQQTFTENSGDEELLDSCQSDLVSMSTSYDQLLYVTITLCVCFCVAMVVTILLLVVMVCVSKRQKSHTCKHCNSLKK